MVVFDAFTPMPEDPTSGLHIAQTRLGEVIDIVVQNNKASAFNGDYRCDLPSVTGTAIAMMLVIKISRTRSELGPWLLACTPLAQQGRMQGL